MNQNINEAITVKRSNLYVIRKSNNLVQALQLPVCANINPRSLYNCSEEFKTYVQEENIDVAFLSETWERENKPLTDIINIPSHTIISNVYQRKGVGGRTALVINHDKFKITTPVESHVSVPWGLGS